MISQKFASLSDESIARYISGTEQGQMPDAIPDSVDSVTDLWTLAKMKDSYNEQT